MLRIWRIFLVLTKYFFTSLSPFYRYNLRQKAKLLRETIETLGGAFIKFGQLLALRVDLLPTEYCQEFMLLFDQVKPFPFSQVKKIFRRDLGYDLEEKFSSVEEKPLAAASFAQVHKAVLLDGQEVVIKVQRPSIAQDLKIDLRILSFLVYPLGLIIKIEIVSLKDVVREFREWTQEELDYHLEATNCQKIYQNLQENELFVVPRIFPEFTSRHILVQEYLPGLPFTAVLKKAIAGTLDKNEFLEKGIDLHKLTHQIVFEMMRQYFIDGIYHADPHPGNIILMKNGKVGLIDFGIVRSVNADVRNFYHCMKAAVDEDFKKAAYHLLQFASRHFIRQLQIILPSTAKKGKADQLVDELADNYYQSLKGVEYTFRGQLARKEIEYTSMFLKIAKFGERYNIKLPSDFIALLRAMSFLGIEMKIVNDNFMMADVMQEFFRQYPIETICLSGSPEELVSFSPTTALESLIAWLSSISEIDFSLYSQMKNYLSQYTLF